MPDYIETAILRRLDALAGRYGIRPYEFLATLQPDPQTGTTMLRFEISAQDDALTKKRFEQMLRSIGAIPRTRILKDRPRQIIDALDHALRCAPDRRRDSSAL